MITTIEIPELVLQTQPTGATCVQTCIAMALSIPAEKVIKKYGSIAMNQTELVCVLNENGIIWNQFCFGTFVHPGWYFVSVPSLNRIYAMHEILLRYTYEEGIFILDPSPWITYTKDGSNLISWSDVTAFIPGGSFKEKP